MNKSRAAAAILYAFAVVSSCGLLIEIPQESGIVFCPSTDNQILRSWENPRVCFDFAVDEYSVEQLFSVTDAAGPIQGCLHWQDRSVCFQPDSEWIPGRRYEFSFSGVFRDLRGIEHVVHRITPFFSERTNATAPYVRSTDPPCGQILACDQQIRIVFSQPIDPSSLPLGFRIEPDTPIEIGWEHFDTEVVLSPDERWRNCQRYVIELGEEIRAADGIPLAESRELVFWVQEDIVCPRILSVMPVLNLAMQMFPETGFTIEEGVGLKDALRVEFSEAMNPQGTVAALSIHPATAIDTVWLDDSTLIVAPAGGFASATEYRLEFGSEAEDAAGNPIEMQEPIGFETIPGAITVVTELANDGILLGPGDYSTARAVEISPYPICSAADYELSFHFTGVQFGEDSEKSAVHEAISLVCVFPDAGVADPTATGFSWRMDSHLSITFSDLRPSTSEQRVYYLLRIRGASPTSGAPGGITAEDGCRLERDLEQLLATAVE